MKEKLQFVTFTAYIITHKLKIASVLTKKVFKKITICYEY